MQAETPPYIFEYSIDGQDYKISFGKATRQQSVYAMLNNNLILRLARFYVP